MQKHTLPIQQTQKMHKKERKNKKLKAEYIKNRSIEYLNSIKP